jgi:geranylgeranyl pyrophosphate synthase
MNIQHLESLNDMVGAMTGVAVKETIPDRFFDEATALLAGDALLTHAFALLATAYATEPILATALVRTLGDAAGSQHLIGGQMQDLLSEKKSDATQAELEYIHLNKTAAMIEASLVMGGLCGGATPTQAETLRTAGRHLGLAFQIVDDVLDATSDTATLGKTAGKDARADKTTYVKLHGLEKARSLAHEQTAAAANAAVLSKASAEMVDAFRKDVADLRGQVDTHGDRIEVLEVRDRSWTRFYADLHSRWPHHRQQDAAPTIDL